MIFFVSNLVIFPTWQKRISTFWVHSYFLDLFLKKTNQENRNEHQNVDKFTRTDMTVGASGGSSIISSVLQVIMNVIAFQKDISTAIFMPRFHHQLIPDYLMVEHEYPSDIVEALRAKGHDVVVQPLSATFSAVQAIVEENGILYAASDPRKLGTPAGY